MCVCVCVCVRMCVPTTVVMYKTVSHHFPPSLPSPPSPAWPSAVLQSSSWSPALVGHALLPYASPLSLSPHLPTLSGAHCLAGF